jgi:hypothetical protein
MTLFGRNKDAGSHAMRTQIPGFAAYAAQSGWRPLGPGPLCDQARKMVASQARVMHGRFRFEEQENQSLDTFIDFSDEWTGAIDGTSLRWPTAGFPSG